MGNSCTVTEDTGLNKLVMQGVGNFSQGITDDQLNASLPNDSLKQKVALSFEC